MTAKYPTRAELARGRLKATARDVKARGGNPVTVGDLRQRHSVGNEAGKPFLSTLLRRGRA